MSVMRVLGAMGSIAKGRQRWWACCIVAAAMMLFATGLVQPVAAITIFMDYDSEDEDPSWDIGGAILREHFQAAAWIWEQLLPSQGNPPTTYTIQIEWEDDWDDSTTLGSWTYPNHIEINSNHDWFHDAPNDNDDFDFTNPATPDPLNQGQTLYCDLTSSQRSEWFPGTAPPDVLEVGFRGRAVSGSAAEGKPDLLSTIVHEIGHHLGINGEEPGEYNIYPHHVGGLTDVLVKEDESTSHLAGDGDAPWIMQEGGGRDGVRRLPSATDVLVIAEDQSLPAVHLPRVDRIGNGSWSSTWKWIGGQVPGSNQDTFVRHGGEVSLDENGTVKSLLIANSSTVATQGHTLAVPSEPTVVNLGSRLQVDAGGHAELYQLYLNDGATLTMDGGSAMVWEGLELNLSSGAPSTIQGRGYVEVAMPLYNNGVIRGDGGTLSFGYGGFDPTPLDLDGNMPGEYGRVWAIDGDLLFSAGLTDAFDGNMWITEGHTITMDYNGGWTLGPDGVLNFDTDPPNLAPATLDGSWTSVRGHINVRGPAVIDTVLQFESTADVSIDTLSDRLLLSGVATMYRGGSYTGDGTLEQRGPASVEEDTQIDVRYYDLDGDEANPSTTTIQPYKTFTINSHQIELTADNDYDGILAVKGGKLKVYTMVFDEGVLEYVPAPWKIDQEAYLYLINGKIPLEIPNGPGAEVHGSPLIVAGHVVVSGEDNIIASGKDKDGFLIPGSAVTFHATADVQLANEEDELYINHSTEYQGGNYAGKGIIHQIGDADFIGDTQINLGTYNWDGYDWTPSTTSITSGATVFIHAKRIDSNSSGYGGLIQIHSGTLIVNTWDTTPPVPPNPGVEIPVPWRLDAGGSLKLFDYAVVSGSTNKNDPSQTVGSTMLVSGSIEASGPGNRIYAPVIFESSAAVTLATDAYLYLHGDTIYRGGSFSGQGIFIQTGDAVVEQPVEINAYRFNMDGGTESTTWTLQNDLRINADRLDLYDNIFDGTINVLSNARLTVNLTDGDRWEMDGLLTVGNAAQSATFHLDGNPVRIDGSVGIGLNSTAVFHSHVSGTADFPTDGSVQFLGGYSPGASPAVVEFGGDVLFGPDGTLSMEMADTSHSDSDPGYDQLVIGGDLEIDGVLDLIFIERFAPQVGDTFYLFHVDGAIQGDFTEVNILNLEPGFQYATVWERGTFRLTALSDGTYAYPADLNGDGFVGSADLDIVRGHWRERVTPGNLLSGDPSWDGLVDSHDLDLVRAQWGSGTMPVPEPGGVLLILCGSVFAALRFRGR